MKINGVYFNVDRVKQYTMEQFMVRFQHLWPMLDADKRRTQLETAYQLIQLYANRT